MIIDGDDTEILKSLSFQTSECFIQGFFGIIEGYKDSAFHSEFRNWCNELIDDLSEKFFSMNCLLFSPSFFASPVFITRLSIVWVRISVECVGTRIPDTLFLIRN